MANPTPQTLPLLFSFKQLVTGNGFLAGVKMSGRALLEHEFVDGQGEVWISGVAPVGIAGGGGDRTVAFNEFRKAWMHVIFDFAEEAQDFDEFKDACESFLNSTEAPITKIWKDAVAAIRQRKYSDQSLEKGNADQQVRFEVVDLTHLQPGSNESDNRLEVAA